MACSFWKAVIVKSPYFIESSPICLLNYIYRFGCLGSGYDILPLYVDLSYALVVVDLLYIHMHEIEYSN